MYTLVDLLISLASLAGKSTGQIESIMNVAAIPRSKRTFMQTAQLASYSVVHRLGFFGILLCASIPNPLFDLAGLTCGYFGVPFSTFASATLIGKGLIKATMQSAFVVFLFSKDHLEQCVTLVQRIHAPLGYYLSAWLNRQRTVFQELVPDATVWSHPHPPDSFLDGLYWNNLACRPYHHYELLCLFCPALNSHPTGKEGRHAPLSVANYYTSPSYFFLIYILYYVMRF